MSIHSDFSFSTEFVSDNLRPLEQENTAEPPYSFEPFPRPPSFPAVKVRSRWYTPIVRAVKRRFGQGLQQRQGKKIAVGASNPSRLVDGDEENAADTRPPSNAHPRTPTPTEPAQRPTHTDNTQDAGGSGGSSNNGFDQSGSEAQPVDIDESGIPTPESRQGGSFTGNSISGSSFDFVSGDQQRIENNNNQVTTGSYNQHNTYNNNYNHPKAGLGMIIATGAGGIGVGTAGSSLYYNKYWEPKAPRANNMTDCPNLAMSMTLTAAILSKTKIRVLLDVCRNAF